MSDQEGTAPEFGERLRYLQLFCGNDAKKRPGTIDGVRAAAGLPPVPCMPGTLDAVRQTLIMRLAAVETEWDLGMLTPDGYRARKDAIVAEVTGLFRDMLRRTMALDKEVNEDD